MVDFKFMFPQTFSFAIKESSSTSDRGSRDEEAIVREFWGGWFPKKEILISFSRLSFGNEREDAPKPLHYELMRREAGGTLYTPKKKTLHLETSNKTTIN